MVYMLELFFRTDCRFVLRVRSVSASHAWDDPTPGGVGYRVKSPAQESEHRPAGTVWEYCAVELRLALPPKETTRILALGDRFLPLMGESEQPYLLPGRGVNAKF